jgi:enoyl-CoA hydratase/carnithine racemase
LRVKACACACACACVFKEKDHKKKHDHGAQALSCGLINKVVPADQLRSTAQELAQKIAQVGASTLPVWCNACPVVTWAVTISAGTYSSSTCLCISLCPPLAPSLSSSLTLSLSLSPGAAPCETMRNRVKRKLCVPKLPKAFPQNYLCREAVWSFVKAAGLRPAAVLRRAAPCDTMPFNTAVHDEGLSRLLAHARSRTLARSCVCARARCQAPGETVRIGKQAFYTQAAMPNLDSAYGFAQQVMVLIFTPILYYYSLLLVFTTNFLDSANGFAQQVMVLIFTTTLFTTTLYHYYPWSLPSTLTQHMYALMFFLLPLREIAEKRESRPPCLPTPDPHHRTTLPLSTEHFLAPTFT